MRHVSRDVQGRAELERAGVLERFTRQQHVDAELIEQPPCRDDGGRPGRVGQAIDGYAIDAMWHKWRRAARCATLVCLAVETVSATGPRLMTLDFCTALRVFVADRCSGPGKNPATSPHTPRRAESRRVSAVRRICRV